VERNRKAGQNPLRVVAPIEEEEYSSAGQATHDDMAYAQCMQATTHINTYTHNM